MRPAQGSGFEYYGNAAASMRDLNTSSAEQCSAVQAQVRDHCGRTNIGAWEFDNYTRVITGSQYPCIDPDWVYAAGRAYRTSGTYTSPFYGLNK